MRLVTVACGLVDVYIVFYMYIAYNCIIILPYHWYQVGTDTGSELTIESTCAAAEYNSTDTALQTRPRPPAQHSSHTHHN